MSLGRNTVHQAPESNTAETSHALISAVFSSSSESMPIKLASLGEIFLYIISSLIEILFPIEDVPTTFITPSAGELDELSCTP